MSIDWRDRISTSGAVAVSIIVVVTFGGVCAALFAFKIPQEMKELAMLILGILGAGFTTIVNYWTGSTSSSQKKDAVIADSATSASAAVNLQGRTEQTAERKAEQRRSP